jgi:hypothetical protein
MVCSLEKYKYSWIIDNMLTKNDLKQIANVVDERLEIKLEEKLESKLEEKLESKLEEKLESKLKPIKKDLRYIKKTIDIIVKNYDEADVKLDRRVRGIESHLGLTSQ